MNKPSKIALALAMAAATASGAVSAQTVDNWRNPFGDVWKNGTNELCWRDNFWTPATGIPGCDGVPVAQAQAPVVAPTASKVVLNADTFFDFDKATIKPEGRQVLDQVAAQANRSEEHTSELQSLMRISYAVFCLKKKKKNKPINTKHKRRKAY